MAFPSEQPADNVHLPSQTNFVTGGGYLVLTSSEAGIYAGDWGSKANFGVNVKYNKAGTNLQGNVNMLVRKGTTVYHFKSNAIIQLNVFTTASPYSATFTSKASGEWWDASAPSIITSLGGNWTVQLQIHDVAEPGAGKDTKEQVIGGGNLQVH